MEGKNPSYKANADFPTVTNQISSHAKVLHDVPFAEELTGTLRSGLAPPGTLVQQARSETGSVQLAAKPEPSRSEHLHTCQLSGPAALQSWNNWNRRCHNSASDPGLKESFS